MYIGSSFEDELETGMSIVYFRAFNSSNPIHPDIGDKKMLRIGILNELVIHDKRR